MLQANQFQSLDNSAAFLQWLFQVSNAGVQISGDPGCGKSNTMELIAQGLVRSKQPFILIDPHGTLARRVERFCSYDLIRKRLPVIRIKASDTNHMVAINPLFVSMDGCNETDWRARIKTKAAHVARILLAACGERNFNDKPRMYTWTMRILRTLAYCGLPLADAKHFFDVGSAVYMKLAQAAPDWLDREAFANLPNRRDAEIDEQIDSTRSRFLGFLSNPIIECMLGRVENVLNMQDVLESGTSLIIDLHPEGNLADEDQQILANLFLSEAVFTAINLPEQRRRPFWILIDELSVFESSFPLIAQALREVRKFGIRFVGAHQGTQFFPDKTEDRLLHTFVGMCGVNLIMQHTSSADARYFGEVIGLRNYNPKRVKYKHRQEQQYQDGWTAVPLFDESFGETDGEVVGGGVTDGTTSSDTWGTDTGSSEGSSRVDQRDERWLRHMVNEAKSQVFSERSREGGSKGTSHQQSRNWSKSKNWQRTLTKKQTLVPIIKTKEVVTSVQFYTPDEHMLEQAADVTRFERGEAAMLVSGHGLAYVKLPLAEDILGGVANKARRNMLAFRDELHKLPLFTTEKAIQAERQQLLDRITKLIDDAIRRDKTALPAPHSEVERKDLFSF